MSLYFCGQLASPLGKILMIKHDVQSGGTNKQLSMAY